MVYLDHLYDNICVRRKESTRNCVMWCCNVPLFAQIVALAIICFFVNFDTAYQEYAAIYNTSASRASDYSIIDNDKGDHDNDVFDKHSDNDDDDIDNDKSTASTTTTTTATTTTMTTMDLYRTEESSHGTISNAPCSKPGLQPRAAFSRRCFHSTKQIQTNGKLTPHRRI